MELDEITLIPMTFSDVPTWANYGFPTRFRVTVSKSGSFDDAFTVEKYGDRSISSAGENLVGFPLQRRSVGANQLNTTQLWERTDDYPLALSELMALDGGKNAALHADVRASDALDDLAYSAVALTDGQPHGGRLLDLPDWLSHLEKRQHMEQEHVILKSERDAQLARSASTSGPTASWDTSTNPESQPAQRPDGPSGFIGSNTPLSSRHERPLPIFPRPSFAGAFLCRPPFSEHSVRH